jgi:hypothetical protein
MQDLGMLITTNNKQNPARLNFTDNTDKYADHTQGEFKGTGTAIKSQ